MDQNRPRPTDLKREVDDERLVGAFPVVREMINPREGPAEQIEAVEKDLHIVSADPPPSFCGYVYKKRPRPSLNFHKREVESEELRRQFFDAEKHQHRPSPDPYSPSHCHLWFSKGRRLQAALVRSSKCRSSYRMCGSCCGREGGIRGSRSRSKE